MRKLFLVSFLLIVNFSFGQNSNLNNIICNADSIIFLSHKSTSDGGIQFFDSISKEYYAPDLLIDSTLNPAVILKKIKLSKNQILELKKCLFYKDKTSIIPSCYNPHHSIEIFSKKGLYLIDLCFECNGDRIILGNLEYKLVLENYVKLKKMFNNLGLIEADENYDK